MVQDVLRNIIKGNSCFGLECSDFKGERQFYALGLKKSKGKLNICLKESQTSLQELVKTIGKTRPIHLVVNTSDVLTKKLENTSSDSVTLLNEAFPNLNHDDFYYEILNQKNNTFISICRKEQLDILLNELLEVGLSVIDFSLGVLPMLGLLKFIKNTNALNVSNAVVSINNGQIESISKSSELENTTYDINGLNISSNYILSTAVALSMAVDKPSSQNNYETLSTDLKDDYKNKKIFKLISNGSLIFLFVMLLGNFMLYNHYFNQVNQLQEDSQMVASSKDKVMALTAKTMKSKKMIEDVQRAGDSKATYFINDLVIELPNSISLTSVNFQPISKRIEPNKPIKNDDGEILISGNCKDNKLYSEWLSAIERLDWVRSVDILNFESNSNVESDFSLKINIDEAFKA